MGLFEFLSKDDDMEYRRDVPEDVRQSLHRMLDKVLDIEDDGNSCYFNIKLRRKIEGARELYPIKGYKKGVSNDR